jgi:hypothetical protein
MEWVIALIVVMTTPLCLDESLVDTAIRRYRHSESERSYRA